MQFLKGGPQTFLLLIVPQNEDISLGDIVVLDLGLGSLFSSFPDRKELPKDPASSLETSLRAAYSHLSPSEARDAFLRFFLSLFGWYRRFVRFDQGGHVARQDTPFGGPSATCHLWFDHRTFVESVRDKKTAAFLNGFQGSQMYEAFVREVLARAALCASGEDPFSTEVSPELCHLWWSRKLREAGMLSRRVSSLFVLITLRRLFLRGGKPCVSESRAGVALC